MNILTEITTQGSSVQEAISKGLHQLNIDQDQAEIEILVSGKQSFMGVGGVPAVVRVAIKAEVLHERELLELVEHLQLENEAQELGYCPRRVDTEQGTIEVIDGEIVVHDAPEGRTALIRPGKHVRVFVNGVEVVEYAEVTSQDRLELQIIHEEPVSEYELSTEQQDLEAYLRLIRRPGVFYKLKNQNPVNDLVLLSEPVQIREAPLETVARAVEFLQKQGIVIGIDTEAIKEVIANPNSDKKIKVATGIPIHPASGVNIEYLFSVSDATAPVYVAEGDILAVKIPGFPGKPGTSVKGTRIYPPAPTDIQLLVKNGCRIVENGSKVIAEDSGRVTVEQMGAQVIIGVLPVYCLEEVSFQTGIVKFSGDIYIKGDVLQGSKIEADGNIEVLGNTIDANLVAGGSIHLHNEVRGCSLSAGGRGIIYKQILPVFYEVKKLLDSFYDVVQQLKKAQGFRTSDLAAQGDGPLLQLLMESKFQRLPMCIAELHQKISEVEDQLHEELIKIVKLVHRCLYGKGPSRIESAEFLQTLERAVNQGTLLLENQLAQPCEMKLSSVTDSKIVCGGKVIIEGVGINSSTISAGDEVVISGSTSLVKGVKITADGKVQINRLVSELGTQTIVKTSADGHIRANSVEPNVILQVGSEKFRVDDHYKNLVTFLDEEGKLVRVEDSENK